MKIQSRFVASFKPWLSLAVVLVSSSGPDGTFAEAIKTEEAPTPATIEENPARSGSNETDTCEESYDRAWNLSAELHFSVLSDVADQSVLGDSFGYGLEGGYRWGRWGILVHGEQNLWFTSEAAERRLVQGALNLGLGGELLYFNGRMESSLILGPSVLLFDTALDDAPKAGLFAEARFTTIRFNVHRNWVIRLAPLTFAIVAPVLAGIPLIRVEYRTVLTVELRMKRRSGKR